MGHWYNWLPAITGALQVVGDILTLALLHKNRRARTRRHPVTKDPDLNQ